MSAFLGHWVNNNSNTIAIHPTQAPGQVSISFQDGSSAQGTLIGSNGISIVSPSGPATGRLVGVNIQWNNNTTWTRA